MGEENVIRFPRAKLNSPPESPEEVTARLVEYRRDFADEISGELWNYVLGELVRSGCNIEGNEDTIYPSMVLILESIRSLHLQCYGVEHPLQEIALRLYEDSQIMDEEDDED